MSTIRLSTKTLDRLEKHGGKRDTWEEIVIRILDQAEQQKPTAEPK